MRWSLGAKRVMLELHYVQNTLGWHGEAKYSRHLSSLTSSHYVVTSQLGLELLEPPTKRGYHRRPYAARGSLRRSGGRQFWLSFLEVFPSAFISKLRQFLNFSATSWLSMVRLNFTRSWIMMSDGVKIWTLNYSRIPWDFGFRYVKNILDLFSRLYFCLSVLELTDMHHVDFGRSIFSRPRDRAARLG